MGSQPSTDITMSSVSLTINDSTANASDTCVTLTSSSFLPASTTSKSQRALVFTALPDELVAMCYASLSATDLVALEHVSRRLRHLIVYDSMCWKRCTEDRWGQLSSNSAILGAAARHAGTWKQLYSEKALGDRQNAPWHILSKSETLAILDIIKGEKTSVPARVCWPTVTNPDPVPSSPPKDSVSPLPSSSPVSVMTDNVSLETLSVVLLIDASSSVTDEDFDCMKSFALELVENLRASHPEAFVAVVQFNQHPKVEVGLTNVCKSKLSMSIENMEQLMGSTDIAAPIRRARQMLGEDDVRPGDKAIVLLTDGQTHADELRESEREAQRASAEVGARLYTLGVGRDIDEVGLGRVASGSNGGMHFTLRRLVPSK